MAELGIKRIGHVALKVADMDRSLAFYRDTLGFQEMMRLDKEDGSLFLVYLRITDTQYLELFPDGEGKTPGPNQSAVHHFCLECEDLEAAAAALREKGVKLTVEPQTGLDHNRQCWIADPEGNRVEFMQMAPNALQLEAIRRLSAA